MKKIVVTSLNWKEIVEVDDSIFDDYKVEACTQAMERAISNGNSTVTALLQCWLEPKNDKSKKTVSVYNRLSLLQKQ